MKKILTASLAANCLALISLVFFIEHRGGIAWIKARLRPTPAASMPHDFDRGWFPIQTNDIVMLGDSIIGYCEWDRLLPSPVRNRGIPGDTTADVLARVKTVAQAHPRIMFLEVGINDLIRGVPQATTLSNYSAILSALSPARVVCLGLMAPDRAQYQRYLSCQGVPMPSPDQVSAFNNSLKFLAEKHGCSFVALPPLKSETTADGLHPNCEGYRLIAAQLAPHIRQ